LVMCHDRPRRGMEAERVAPGEFEGTKAIDVGVKRRPKGDLPRHKRCQQHRKNQIRSRSCAIEKDASRIRDVHARKDRQRRPSATWASGRR